MNNMEQAYISHVMEKLEHKIDRMIEQIGTKSPHVAKEDGVYDDMPIDWWTSGFWPGLLWIAHAVSGKEHYKEAAWGWDARMEQGLVTPSRLHHDVGFQFLPTAVIKHTLTGDADGLRRGLQAANFLAGRFNPAGNFIRAWNDHTNGRSTTGWAIIDCMMNLSLLFWASQVSGDPRFKHVAVRHADTAMRTFVRQDGSVNHIVSFDPETGEFIESLGGQGYGPHSAWSRGAAWALYGFAHTYKYTSDVRFLDTAKRVAHFFIASLPEDHVPHWDFRAGKLDEEPRDSSAGAIAASGLIELAKHVPEAEASFYMDKAHKILKSLTENYATWEQPEHQAILTHGTGHKPANQNVDVSLIYGDYYYVEAFAKLSGWKGTIF
jgi:unsaturated chondroitin disaccharide hydrolase